MKAQDGLLRRFGPLWLLLAAMLFLFFTSTLPAIRGNRALEAEALRRKREIESLERRIEERCNDLRALGSDPITVENEIRKAFGGARRAGEILPGEE